MVMLVVVLVRGSYHSALADPLAVSTRKADEGEHILLGGAHPALFVWRVVIVAQQVEHAMYR